MKTSPFKTKRISLIVVLGLIAGVSSSLAAPPKVETKSDAFDLPQVVAIESRKFNPKNDVTANISVLPLDAFYKAIGFGVSYTQSFDSMFSWEVVNAQATMIQNTSLKNDLIQEFQVRPKGILDNVGTLVTTNLIFTPIYTKNLFLNRNVVHGEFSMVFGGGVLRYTSGDMAAMYGLGVILRFFQDQLLSYKLDSRIYYQTAPNKSSDLVMTIGVGLSFELGNSKPRSEGPVNE